MTTSKMSHKKEGLNVKCKEFSPVGGRLFVITLVLFFIMFFIRTASAANNLTTGWDIYGIFGDGTNRTEMLNLTLQVRSCISSDCSDGVWSSFYTNATYTSLASFGNTSYFQYKANFFTEDQNYTPWLFNVSIDYCYNDLIAPLVDFVSPSPLQNAYYKVTEAIFNISIVEAILGDFKWNWNGVNYTFFNKSDLQLMINFDNVSALGDNATYATDASGNLNNANLYGNARYNISGKYGDSLQLDGSSFIGVNHKNCPQNMSYINKLGGFCIDQYEASLPSANSTDMGSSGDIANRNNPGSIVAKSISGVVPWVEVSQISARTACTNAGKRLCNDNEWLAAANLQGQVYNLPTDPAVSPYYCVTGSSTWCVGKSWNGTGIGTNGNACNTGKNSSGSVSRCVSAEGVYDMLGNLWEWTNGTGDVVNPLTNSTGGLAGWYYYNGTGWQTSTSAATTKYGNDGTYFPANSTGMAVLRGGSWYAGADVGPFCSDLTYGPTYSFASIGFRCCSS